MKILKARHQGDVLLLTVDSAPDLSNAKALQIDREKGTILQHGEALGHYHRIPPHMTDGFKAYMLAENKDGVSHMLVEAARPVELVHEEHRTLQIEEGFTIVRTQREKSRGLTRRVVD